MYPKARVARFVRMKGPLAWMLLAMVGAWALTPNAGAAEIPPTEECVSSVKKLISENPEIDELSESELKKAERIFARGLADAGCISDATPFLEKVTLKPGSKHCRQAARAADAYWKPYARKFDALDAVWKKYGEPKEQRIGRIQARIRQLREAGAPQARISQLLRTRRALGRRLTQFSNRLQSKLRVALGPARYGSFLTLSELVSLRCIDRDVFGGSNPSGPAGRVVVRNYETAFVSLIYLADEPGGEVAIFPYLDVLNLD